MAFRSMISKSLQQFRDKTANNGGIVSPNNMIMIETDGVSGSPLSAMANSFEELSAIVSGGAGNDDLRLKPFCDACCHVSTLFGCLGIAFKFAEMEYTGKVRDLTQAAQSYGTLNSILDSDLRNDRVRTPGSMSRNLRRVRQGLDLIRALFINFLSSDDFSLKEAASTAYAKVCAPYHTWAVRTAVSAGMCALPTREQLLLKLNETEESAEKQMRRYIEASLPIIQYVDKLYISRNIDLDW